MRIATYLVDGQRHVGLVSADGKTVTPLALDKAQSARGALGIIESLAAGGKLPASAGPALQLSQVTLDAPLPQPRRNLWCVGRNYHAHARELSASVFKDNDENPESWPIVFTKVPECVVGPHDDVLVPSDISTQIDYEAELAVVIGRTARRVSADDALDFVSGYLALNDVSDREAQMKDGQWSRAKSYDTFGPCGPRFVPAAAIADPQALAISCDLNGERMQDSNTANMIFGVRALIEFISARITLDPGDVISTGTPDGVGAFREVPVFLKPGDEMTVTVEGIGQLTNRVVRGE